MSFLNTTAKLEHSTPLPEGTTVSQGVAMLHDHAFFLTCNPVATDVIRLTGEEASTAAAASSAVPVPAEFAAVQPIGAGEPDVFRVTDVVANPVWDSRVVSTYAFLDVQTGTRVRVTSPLAIVTDTLWEIREEESEGEKSGRVVLVEQGVISCSRLLVGLVKGQTEKGWPSIHRNMAKRLEQEVATKGDAAGDAGNNSRGAAKEPPANEISVQA